MGAVAILHFSSVTIYVSWDLVNRGRPGDSALTSPSAAFKIAPMPTTWTIKASTRTSILAIFLLLMLTLGCSSSENGVEELGFDVDPTLLGDHVEDGSSGFAVYAPAGWPSVADSVFRQTAVAIEREGARPGDRFKPTLLALFRHPGHGGHLAVMKYAEILNEADRDSVIRWQRSGLDRAFAGTPVRPAQFSYRGFLLDQFVGMDSQKVVFKLMVYRSKTGLYQLDYVIPRGSYKDELRAIESSVGSLDSRDFKQRR